MEQFQEIANKAVAEYLESGKMETRITESINTCFDKCIEEAFRWGPLKKSIQEVINKKLVIAVDDIDVQSYNEIMLATLKGTLAKFTNDQALKDFTKLLNETFGTAPEEVHIKDVVEKVLDSWRDDDPCCEAKTATIEFKADHFSKGSHSLDITDGEKYSSEQVKLYFIDGRLRLSHRMDMNPTTLGGVEGYLFNLYAGKTKILGLEDFDEMDFDLELGARE